VVFSPNYWRKMLVPPSDRRIKERILEKQDPYNDPVVEMEGMGDHMQLLLEVDPRIGIDRVVRKSKGDTAPTIRQAYPWMKHRLPSLWTRSRFIASVGCGSLQTVKPSIEEQQGA
jgi:putative transposase